MNLVGKRLTLLAAAPSAVSAFYAECLNKKIQFNAHIWTKSKFLGMSIGVHNIGQGKLLLLLPPPPQSRVPSAIWLTTFPPQVACPVWNTTSITYSPSPTATAGSCCRSALCFCGGHVLLRCPPDHDVSPIQVDSNGALGGAGWRVQHLLLQVGLQCQHCLSHQTFLRREEAQSHC